MIKASIFLGLGVATATALVLGVGCSSGEREATESGGSAAVRSSSLTISQVYTAGGVKGAAYSHDYVEIFNRDQWPVNLEGVSLQITGANENFDAKRLIKLPNKTIGRNKYFLVELAPPGSAASGMALPTADHHSDLALSDAEGKVALVRSPLEGCGSEESPCRPSASLSMVSYMPQAREADAGVAAGTTAIVRKDAGCVDTGSDADFDLAAAPTPRNSASPAAQCAAPVAPPVDGGASLVLLNEIKVAATGGITGSPYGYVEIICTPGAALTNHYFVTVDTTGRANFVFDLGKRPCGSNGLVYIKSSGTGGHLSGESQSVVLPALNGPDGGVVESSAMLIVKSSTPLPQGTDFDGESGAAAELPPGGVIVDALALLPAGAPAPKFIPRIDQTPGSAAAASRIVGNKAPLQSPAWYAGALKGGPDSKDYDPAKSSGNLPAGAVITPGAVNFEKSTDAGTGGAKDGGGSSSGDAAPAEAPAPATEAEAEAVAPPAAPPAPTGLRSADSVCSMSSGLPAAPGFAAFAMFGIAITALKRRASRRSC